VSNSMPQAPLTTAPAGAGSGLTPAVVDQLPEPLHSGVVDAFASSLAPAFWYLVPLVAVGLVLALFLKEVKLSNEAGMIARGEEVMEDSAADSAEDAAGEDAGRAAGDAAKDKETDTLVR